MWFFGYILSLIISRNQKTKLLYIIWSSFLKRRWKFSYRLLLTILPWRNLHHRAAIIRWHLPLSRYIQPSSAAPLKNIVKTALKYYTVSHRKNCCAVDGNLPLSPCASDDSYCSHEENTSAVTLNSRAGGTPSMNTANYPDISSLHIGAPH